MHIVYESAGVLLLAVHLWCMNISSASPLLAALIAGKAARDKRNDLANIARRELWLGLVTLLIGAAIGLGLAAVMWAAGDDGLFEVLPVFSYKINWALAELGFYVVCVLIAIVFTRPHRLGRRGVHVGLWIVGILASTNMMYHFPPLFAVMSVAAQSPESLPDAVRAAEFRELMTQGAVLPLTAHFALASLAVGGALLTYRLSSTAPPQDEESTPPPSTEQQIGRLGSGVALFATVSQILVGMWIVVKMPPISQRTVMGGDVLGTACLGLSILLAFSLMHRLASATFHPSSRETARTTLGIMFLIVLLMTITLRRSERSQPDQARYRLPQTSAPFIPADL